MTPRAIRRELRVIDLQLTKALRVDARYRDYIQAAIARLELLDAAVKLDSPRPGPKPRGQA